MHKPAFPQYVLTLCVGRRCETASLHTLNHFRYCSKLYSEFTFPPLVLCVKVLEVQFLVDRASVKVMCFSKSKTTFSQLLLQQNLKLKRKCAIEVARKSMSSILCRVIHCWFYLSGMLPLFLKGHKKETLSLGG